MEMHGGSNWLGDDEHVCLQVGGRVRRARKKKES
jgi:hypothetical protein